jgi:hypothetical protein
MIRSSRRESPKKIRFERAADRNPGEHRIASRDLYFLPTGAAEFKLFLGAFARQPGG